MRLKVLHVINDLTIGGAEALLTNSLSNGGLQEHTDNMILYLQGNSELIDKVDTKVKLINLHYKGWYTIGSMLMKIRKVIKKYQPDIIHTHLNPAGWYTSLVKPKHIPQVHTLHISYSDNTDTGKIQLYLEKKWLLQKKGANLITLSPLLKEDLVKSVKIKGKVFVLSNFIDDIFFSKKHEIPPARDLFRFIAVGNLRPQKNYNYLLEIFRILKDDPVSVDVYGVGDPSSLNKVVKREGLSVNFMGPSLNLKDIYWRYDGFIMPSRFEGFGLTAYEAMASGLPLLLSDIGAFKSLIKSNALYFSLSDPNDAAEIIRDVLKGKIDIKSMTEKAKEFAWQNVRRDIYIKKLLSIYNEILQ